MGRKINQILDWTSVIVARHRRIWRRECAAPQGICMPIVGDLCFGTKGAGAPPEESFASPVESQLFLQFQLNLGDHQKSDKYSYGSEKRKGAKGTSQGSH
jgi:hypothetical protein